VERGNRKDKETTGGGALRELVFSGRLNELSPWTSLTSLFGFDKHRLLPANVINVKGGDERMIDRRMRKN